VIVAKMHRMTVPEFERALGQASQSGDRSALWYDKRARKNVILPQLPPAKLRETLAHGIDSPTDLPESSRSELEDDTPGDLQQNSPGELPENVHSG
jgi:hypothetical protein